jgi:hypothetical protein
MDIISQDRLAVTSDYQIRIIGILLQYHDITQLK